MILLMNSNIKMNVLFWLVKILPEKFLDKIAKQNEQEKTKN